MRFNEGKRNRKQKWVIKTKPHLGENALSNSEWIVRWMQEAGPTFEDYVRKSGLKLPQVPVAKYEVKAKPSKRKEEKESNVREDPREDLEEDSKNKLGKVDEASDPDLE
ncbi:hypothetical protein PVK06_012498 [Gossypium arboreum]|uniref:Uncharacterized protein n=1 Tax=Gossypium arboreum TaxID=29729 RepID=A0ABR0QBR4_GOSAR|nr:hypothetical protein PVK06_012498 [Gossypium arboreum]